MMQFMQGRYGADQMGQMLSAVSMVFLIISLFSRNQAWFLLAVIGIVYNYFRMFSKNISKRAAENQKYMNFRYRAVCFFKKGRTGGSASFAQKQAQRKAHHEQKKMYRFFACPNCAQKVRVPKGKGKICITCPKCHTEFVKRS